MFLLVFLVLGGAWLGFWVVHKLVLTEDGSIDIGVANFVAWSIRIFASVMILQSSVDPLLAAEALICGILLSSILRKITRPRFVRHLYKSVKLCRPDKSNHRYQTYSSPVADFYGSRPNNKAPYSTPIRGSSRTSPRQLSDSGTFYSTYHDTPERREFSKDEWEKFSRESTKKALEGLVSSPDFSKWAVAHADRITLAPKKETADHPRRWTWLPWL
ncbi:unnamed protein product [Ilex paraguariensis]|uniref:Uncharacterized protein n=1 Tax=Ilex paraguariensis TaxID=185542 RepID=A0ABC8SMC6_9AQUA